jgi:hypothetical protein
MEWLIFENKDCYLLFKQLMECVENIKIKKPTCVMNNLLYITRNHNFLIGNFKKKIPIWFFLSPFPT